MTDSRRDKTGAEPENSHQNVRKEEVNLDSRQVSFFGVLRGDVIENRWRPWHREQTAHDTAQGAHGNLYRQRRLQLDFIAEAKEVDADENESRAENLLQELVVDAFDATDGKKTDYSKCDKDGQVPPDDDVLSHSNYHIKRKA